MRIVVLDGHALNPGDLSWSELERIGECVIHPRTPPEKTVERAKGSEILLTNKVVLSGECIARLPDCRYIGVTATGFNVVDTEAAGRRGIVVTNVPAYADESVAQMVFAHVLDFCLHVREHAMSVRDGDWCRAEDFSYWKRPLQELADKTMGIIGLGRIGRSTARIARAFGMRVLASDPNVSRAPRGVALVPLERLLGESDFVSLHCPLTPATEKLINADRLALMKPTAFLVNTSRGQVVDEPALADALRAGRIAGAGLDVLSVEPPKPDNPLLSAPNCTITPHIAWASRESRARLMRESIENVKAFVAGYARNVVTRI